MTVNDHAGKESTGTQPWPRAGLWRWLLILAALDALAWGLFGAVRPGELCQRLGMEPRNDSWAWQLRVPRAQPPEGIPPPRDAPGLWQLLAFLSLAQAAFLALAAWRPRTLGGLALAPLVWHGLGLALWLWAVGTTYTLPPERVPFPDRVPLLVLAAHDAVCMALMAAFLLHRGLAGRFREMASGGTP